MKGAIVRDKFFLIGSLIILGCFFSPGDIVQGGCACGDRSNASKELAANQVAPPEQHLSASRQATPQKSLKIVHGVVNDLHGRDEFNTFVGISSRATDKLAVVLKFYSNGCGACQSMKEHDKKFSAELKRRIMFGAVEVDDKDQRNPALGREFDIKGIPTYVMFEEGKEVERFVGGDPYGLKDMLDRYAKRTS